jgi:hypothetical protein
MLILDDPTSDETSEAKSDIEEFFLIAYTVEMCLKILGMGFVMNKGCNTLFCYAVQSLFERRLEYSRFLHRCEHLAPSRFRQ